VKFARQCPYDQVLLQQLARLDSKDVEKAVRGALVVYSALRDPTDNMVSTMPFLTPVIQ